MSGSAVRRSLLFTGVHTHSFASIDAAVVLPYAEIGRGARLRNVVIDRGVRIPAGLMFARNATLHLGRAHTRTLVPAVLDLMARGLRPQDVTTTVASWDDAPAALHEHVLGDATKTIVTAA